MPVNPTECALNNRKSTSQKGQQKLHVCVRSRSRPLTLKTVRKYNINNCEECYTHGKNVNIIYCSKKYKHAVIYVAKYKYTSSP